MRGLRDLKTTVGLFLKKKLMWGGKQLCGNEMKKGEKEVGDIQVVTGSDFIECIS